LKKTRVSELAKRFGMKPADLTKKLREIGFERIRSPNSVLDDSELLEVEARLEAYGIIPEKAEEPAEAALGMLRRKPKKVEAAPAGEVAEAVPAPPSEVREPKGPSLVPAAEVETFLPEAPPSEPSFVEPEAEAPAFAAEAEPIEVARPLPPSEPLPSGGPMEVPPSAEAPPVAATAAASGPPFVPVAPMAAAPPVAAPPLRAVAAPVGEIPPAGSPPAAGAAPPSTVPSVAAGPAPSAPPATGAPRPTPTTRRGPKILGKIDLAAIGRPSAAGPAPKGSEPHPTLHHDRARALARGDFASRGTLTSAQLKEREEYRRQRQREVRRGSASGRGGGGRDGPGGAARTAPSTPERPTRVQLEVPITVRTLSAALGVKIADLMRVLFNLLGFGKVNINSVLEEETAALAASEFRCEIEMKKVADVEREFASAIAKSRAAATGERITRPPVIALLGHVDHGKTSLLDAIRKSKIAAGEAGGITQRIGAYQVTTPSGHTITVIDTPGHRAFTAMRARGARSTDIVVLVVAADDGVMPQTEEAIEHARAAKAPIVVALNKSDRPEANPIRVKNQLATLGLIPEEYGGHTGIVETAATTGRGIVPLLERVALEAEVMELRANPDESATGVVLEASVDEGKGIVAHVLVRDGTLRRGDILNAGAGYGRVRALSNDRGEELEEAGPSTPVEVSGLLALPDAGDRFHVVADLAKAREVAEERGKKARAMQRLERPTVTLETLSAALAAGEAKEIAIVLKADVLGSLEALRKEIPALAVPEVDVKLLRSGIGGITEADVLLAETSNGVVLGFNVAADDKARSAAEQHGVEIRTYRVIYELLDEVRKAMEGLLAPLEREQILGHLEIRKVFYFSKIGNIAGCFCTDGTVPRTAPIRLVRDGRVIFTGRLASLRRVKDDVREVKEGFECGAKVEGYDDIKEGDRIESFQIVRERRVLGPAAASSGERVGSPTVRSGST
jgi:translation initiation factor IF-2